MARWDVLIKCITAIFSSNQENVKGFDFKTFQLQNDGFKSPYFGGGWGDLPILKVLTCNWPTVWRVVI